MVWIKVHEARCLPDGNRGAGRGRDPPLHLSPTRPSRGERVGCVCLREYASALPGGDAIERPRANGWARKLEIWVWLWEVPPCIRSKPSKLRVRLPDAKPGQVFDYANNRDGSITLRPVKVATKELPPAEVRTFGQEERHRRLFRPAGGRNRPETGAGRVPVKYLPPSAHGVVMNSNGAASTAVGTRRRGRLRYSRIPAIPVPKVGALQEGYIGTELPRRSLRPVSNFATEKSSRAAGVFFHLATNQMAEGEDDRFGDVISDGGALALARDQALVMQHGEMPGTIGLLQAGRKPVRRRTGSARSAWRMARRLGSDRTAKRRATAASWSAGKKRFIGA